MDKALMKPASKKSRRGRVLSVRAHEELEHDIRREAARRKLNVRAEITRRLQFYNLYKHSFRGD